jgi:hypothetical protein
MFLDKPAPTQTLGELEKSLLARDIVTWPYALPILDQGSDLEMGFNFDSSWPQLNQFAIRYFDRGGMLRHTQSWTKSRPGIVYADELVALQASLGREEIGIIMLSPDWQGLNLDQQANGISVLGDFVLRHRRTGDYDITEYQNCWRNLGVIIDQMPHWIHFSNHVLGGTNLYGRAVARDGWRAGVLLVNGSGNLHYRTEVDYVIKLFDRSGRLHEVERSIRPFTHQLVWLDEAFPDLTELLGSDDYGAIVIRSRTGDLNGQMVTVKDASAVSLQHMWGY